MQREIEDMYNRNDRGTFVALSASLTLAFVAAIGVAFVFIAMIIGGGRELQHAVDSGVLNIAKQVLFNPSVKLSDVSDAARQFQGLGDGDAKDQINLNNINRVWAQAMLIGMNVAHMEETGTATAVAQQHADAMHKTAEECSAKLAAELEKDSQLTGYLEQLIGKGKGNSVRLLNYDSASAPDRDTPWLVSYGDRQGPSNVSIEPWQMKITGESSSSKDALFPYNKSDHALPGHDKNDNRRNDDQGRGQFYLDGYTSIAIGRQNKRHYYFVPLWPQKLPHLVSHSYFEDNKQKPELAGINLQAIVPNMFEGKAKALADTHKTGSKQAPVLHLAAWAQAKPMNKGFKAAIPRGWIKIENSPGFSFQAADEHAAEYANHQLLWVRQFENNFPLARQIREQGVHLAFSAPGPVTFTPRANGTRRCDCPSFAMAGSHPIFQLGSCELLEKVTRLNLELTALETWPGSRLAWNPLQQPVVTAKYAELAAIAQQLQPGLPELTDMVLRTQVKGFATSKLTMSDIYEGKGKEFWILYRDRTGVAASEPALREYADREIGYPAMHLQSRWQGRLFTGMKKYVDIRDPKAVFHPAGRRDKRLESYRHNFLEDGTLWELLYPKAYGGEDKEGGSREYVRALLVQRIREIDPDFGDGKPPTDPAVLEQLAKLFDKKLRMGETAYIFKADDGALRMVVGNNGLPSWLKPDITPDGRTLHLYADSFARLHRATTSRMGLDRQRWLNVEKDDNWDVPYNFLQLQSEGDGERSIYIHDRFRWTPCTGYDGLLGILQLDSFISQHDWNGLSSRRLLVTGDFGDEDSPSVRLGTFADDSWICVADRAVFRLAGSGDTAPQNPPPPPDNQPSVSCFLQWATDAIPPQAPMEMILVCH